MIEEKQQMIEQLKERKVGFENLFIEMGKSNEKLNTVSANEGIQSSNSRQERESLRDNAKEPRKKSG